MPDTMTRCFCGTGLTVENGATTCPHCDRGCRVGKCADHPNCSSEGRACRQCSPCPRCVRFNRHDGTGPKTR